jgi:hypothetical protein
MRLIVPIIAMLTVLPVSAAGLTGVFNDLIKKPPTAPQPVPQPPKPPAPPVKK